ncbi:hypothetical protein [Lysobacter gummosus]|uniref:hypothetical protein n=1 Tax=Lysobacter gummosus TaxID=262324 RepID=UPI003629D46B
MSFAPGALTPCCTSWPSTKVMLFASYLPVRSSSPSDMVWLRDWKLPPACVSCLSRKCLSSPLSAASLS